MTCCHPSHLSSSACDPSPAPASLPTPSQRRVLCSCLAAAIAAKLESTPPPSPEPGRASPVGKHPSCCERRSGDCAQAVGDGRTGNVMGRRSAVSLSQRCLSKLETGEERRGRWRAASLPSRGFLSGDGGSLTVRSVLSHR